MITNNIQDNLKILTTHFFRIEYSIEKDTYGNPEEILKTNLWSAKIQHKIESYTYKFDRIEKGKHYTDYDYVYFLEIYTNLSKSELTEYFNNSCVNSESYKIL